MNWHSGDGNEYTTETWCDIYVKARLVKRGRTISRDTFVAFGAPHNERTRLFYSLSRNGYNKPPHKRAKRLAVRHMYVDRASCAPF